MRFRQKSIWLLFADAQRTPPFPRMAEANGQDTSMSLDAVRAVRVPMCDESREPGDHALRRIRRGDGQRSAASLH